MNLKEYLFYFGMEEYLKQFEYLEYRVNAQIPALKQVNAELEQQIEAMKCCANCIWYYPGGENDNELCNDYKYDGNCGWKLKEAE